MNHVLTEYTDTEIELSQQDIAYIQDTVNEGSEDKQLRIKVTSKEDKYKLRPQGIVGVIQLPSDTRLELQPKIGNMRLLQIWNYVELDESLTDKDLEETVMQHGNQFLDIIAYLYYQEVELILRRGLYKTYKERNTSQDYLKGRLNVREHARQPVKDTFPVTYDELTADNPLNQVLLHATHLLRHVVNNPDLKQKLAMQYQHLRRDVTHTRIGPGELDQITPDRLTSYYGNAISIAKDVITETYYDDIAEGPARTYSFTLNMNDLFERFIRKLLQDAYPSKTIEKTSKNLVKTGKIRIKPDILVKNASGEIELVGDVKYKEKPSSKDYYQAIAYGMAHDVDSFLIHPDSGKAEVYETRTTPPQHVNRVPFNIADLPSEKFIEHAIDQIRTDTIGIVEQLNVVETRAT